MKKDTQEIIRKKATLRRFIWSAEDVEVLSSPDERSIRQKWQDRLTGIQPTVEPPITDRDES